MKIRATQAEGTNPNRVEKSKTTTNRLSVAYNTGGNGYKIECCLPFGIWISAITPYNTVVRQCQYNKHLPPNYSLAGRIRRCVLPPVGVLLTGKFLH